MMRRRFTPILYACPFFLAVLGGCTGDATGTDAGGQRDAHAFDAADLDAAGFDAPGPDARAPDVGPPPSPRSCVESACAFPGAEGFGTHTSGGRGGPVIVVTTLASDGPGSLRAALETSGPRIVVFAVSGVIDLGGRGIDLLGEHSEVTVLGQTSPGGITLTNAGTLLSTYHQDLHDVILRHLRFRGPVTDTISFAVVEDLVIDHCDFSAGEDETLDITYGRNVTVQWSTVTNSVLRGVNGSQNYGTLLAYRPTTNITWHHNLQAHHYGRCMPHMHWVTSSESPRPPPEGGANVDIRNNVVYDCQSEDALYAGEYPETGVNWNFVGNYGRLGPASSADSYFANVRRNIFAEDNVYEGVEYSDGIPFHHYGEWMPQTAPFDFPMVTTTSAAQAYEDVLAFVGAWPRDPMNTRTIAEVRAGTGAIGAVGDPLSREAPAPPADADLDGIADAWESTHGLSPSDPRDSAAIDPVTGYAQVELYAHELARDILGR